MDINSWDEHEFEDESSNAPLSQLLKSRAAEFRNRSNTSIDDKRSALLNSYNKLIEAQNNMKNPYIDTGMGGAEGLMASGDPSMAVFGKMFAGQAQDRQKQLEFENKRMNDAAMLQLKQQAENLGFTDSDTKNELLWLKAAADQDQSQAMIDLKRMMLGAGKKQLMKDGKGNVVGIFDKTTGEVISTPQATATTPTKDIFGSGERDPYADLDSVGQRQLRMQYEKRLAKEQEKATEHQPLIDKAKRFLDLNEKTSTGASGYIPARGVFDPEFSEMESISSEIIPQMRVPGSGASSDLDVKMFSKATFGVTKPLETNKNVAGAYILSKENQMAKTDFLENYLNTKGHLVGAEKVWKKYLNENPIFAKDATTKDFKLNKDRKNWEDYFYGDSKNDEGKEVKLSTDSNISTPPQGLTQAEWDVLDSETKENFMRKYANRFSKP